MLGGEVRFCGTEKFGSRKQPAAGYTLGEGPERPEKVIIFDHQTAVSYAHGISSVGKHVNNLTSGVRRGVRAYTRTANRGHRGRSRDNVYFVHVYCARRSRGDYGAHLKSLK